MKLPRINMSDMFGRMEENVYENYGADRQRDQKYELTSKAGQLWTVFLSQMKLFTKSYLPILMIVFVALIPILIYSGALDSAIIDPIREEIGDTGETYVAICLGLLPVMMALISCMVCGSMLPSEFRYRTAYLNFPLPQSRMTFYLGKFLAGYALVLATILSAFAVSILMATFAGYDSVSSAAIGEAMLLSIAGSFAFCSIAYGLSAFMSHGSTMFPFVLIFIVIPAFTLIMADAGGFGDLVGYVPSFAGDLALASLGSDQTLSVSLLLTNIDVQMTASVPLAATASLICGVLFLLIGMSKTRSREI